MTRFEEQTFEGFKDYDSSRLFENMEFNRCKFFSSSISVATNPQLRSTIRNVSMSNCLVATSFVFNPVIEDVLVNGLQTGADGKSGLIIFGAVFKHLTLRGKIGRLLFNQAAGGPSFSAKQQATFDAANLNYYAKVDWALDIRDAEFVECDVRSVPAKLIRRDPETQVIVRRAKVEEGAWRELDLTQTYWPDALQLMSRSDRKDVVLIAPKQDPKFRELLKGLQLLRRAGVAEPD